jgi:hypothetical protein
MNVRREGRLPDAHPPDIACVQQTSLPASTSAGGPFLQIPRKPASAHTRGGQRAAQSGKCVSGALL